MNGGHHWKARAIGSRLIDGQALVPFPPGHFQDLRAEKRNPAKVRGKSQVRRMSGQLGDWGNRKAVQPALHAWIWTSGQYRCDGRHKMISARDALFSGTG